MPAGGVDQLDLALARLGLAVGQHPHVGGDAGVVEHVEGQGDDRLQPVVLDDPAADVALALAGVAGEEGASVVHLGDAAAEWGALLHLRQLVGEEQHLAVAGSCHQRELRIAAVLDDEARIAHVLLAAHAFEVGLPALAVGRIGQHEVELARREGVVGERRMLRPAHDVVGGLALALEKEIGLADRDRSRR